MAPDLSWSAVQKYFVDERAEELLALDEAMATEAGRELDFVEFCREKLAQPREVLNPPPLLTGDDLIALGVEAGPIFKLILERVRAAQLDREIDTKHQAVELAERLFEEENTKG